MAVQRCTCTLRRSLSKFALISFNEANTEEAGGRASSFCFSLVKGKTTPVTQERVTRVQALHSRPKLMSVRSRRESNSQLD